MRPIGFSTGAVAKGDFRAALDRLLAHRVTVVELSALRLKELAPLVGSLDDLDLSGFEFISFHSPSCFTPEDERFVLEQLQAVVARGIPVVVHPDVIFTVAKWEALGPMLFVENMDKRKSVGRSADDIADLLRNLPYARFCFDVGHARQVDPTMLEARLILEVAQGRLAQVHMSEVNTASRHDPLSIYAISAYRGVASLIPEHTPIILETLIDQGQSDIPTEIDRARRALEVPELAAC
jgi:hypothetical protein